MLALNPKYLVDAQQRRKAVVLPMTDWRCLLEKLEELDDIRLFDKAKAGSQDSVPFNQAIHEIEKVHADCYMQ